MSEKLRQSLSAVIDDEADVFELRRVLDELDRDEELRGLWERYHMIGSAIRGERVLDVFDLRERVWLALEEDADVETRRVSAGAARAALGTVPAADPGARTSGGAQAATPRTWAGRITALSVAASVAFVVVLGVSNIDTETPVPQQALVERQPMPLAPVELPVEVLRASDVSPSDLQRARAYMLHHAGQQAMTRGSVMPFVKMATYEAP
ncbi:MAG: sigma-E factor negative regulatory protein [Pseudomonadales bacterium]